MTDRQGDLKVELTSLTSVPRSPSMLHAVESGIPYNGLYWKAPNEKGSFSGFRCIKGMGFQWL